MNNFAFILFLIIGGFILITFFKWALKKPMQTEPTMLTKLLIESVQMIWLNDYKDVSFWNYDEFNEQDRFWINRYEKTGELLGGYQTKIDKQLFDEFIDKFENENKCKIIFKCNDKNKPISIRIIKC